MKELALLVFRSHLVLLHDAVNQRSALLHLKKSESDLEKS